MRAIYHIDTELGRIDSLLDESLINIYGEVELDIMESIVITGNLLSELYVSSSLVSGDKSLFRIRKEVLSDKVKFILKFPADVTGCIYLVNSLRAYKYVLLNNKNSYNYGY